MDVVFYFDKNYLLIIKKIEKMKTEKLSLNAFKAMADNVQTEDVMNQIEGGNLFDCHGDWGAVGKRVRDIVVEEIIDSIGDAIKKI